MIPGDIIESILVDQPTPSLVFDRKVVADRIHSLRKLQPRFNCRFLMSVKAFPHDEVLRWFAQAGIGFDVSNVAEFRKVCTVARTAGVSEGLHVSLAGPILAGQEKELAGALGDCGSQLARVSVSIGSLDDSLGFSSIENGNVRFGIRLRATPPDLETQGWLERRSRFGLDESDEIMSALRDGIRNYCGFHVHFGAETNTRRLLYEAASRIIDFAQRKRIVLQYINLGGGLLGWSDHDVVSLLGQLRNVVPQAIELLFEPGAFWFQDAGFAVSRVMSVDRLRDGIQRIVVNLSSEAHLKWSAVRLCLPNVGVEKQGVSITVVVYGASCYEKDVIGVFRIPGTSGLWRVGDAMVFSNVNCYSVAWNCEFNGLSRADVKFLSGDTSCPDSDWLQFEPTGAYGKTWLTFKENCACDEKSLDGERHLGT